MGCIQIKQSANTGGGARNSQPEARRASSIRAYAPCMSYMLRLCLMEWTNAIKTTLHGVPLRSFIQLLSSASSSRLWESGKMLARCKPNAMVLTF